MLNLVAAVLAAASTGQERSLAVFAAASLKESMTVLARSYEAAHPGIEIKLNFGGSQTLAVQIRHGAPADVFASAAVANLEEIDYEKSSRQVFVRNRLAIALRKGLIGIRSMRDLSRVSSLVVADVSVPVGRYTEQLLRRAASAFGPNWLGLVRSRIVSREVDVKAVLAKVKLGEGDAGIVYASDVATSRGQVGKVAIPDAWNQVVEYLVAVPSASDNKTEARRFIASLLTPASQKVFVRAGFVPIPAKRAAK